MLSPSIDYLLKFLHFFVWGGGEFTGNNLYFEGLKIIWKPHSQIMRQATFNSSKTVTPFNINARLPWSNLFHTKRLNNPAGWIWVTAYKGDQIYEHKRELKRNIHYNIVLQDNGLNLGTPVTQMIFFNQGIFQPLFPRRRYEPWHDENRV